MILFRGRKKRHFIPLTLLHSTLFLCGLLLLTPARLSAQTSMQRSFKEAGGTVSTGRTGSISTLANGDIVVINDRYTNFSQKGIQLYILDKELLEVRQSTAFYTDVTISIINTYVKGDTIYAAAQLSSGNDYSVMFMSFDKDLNLIHQSRVVGNGGYLVYSFLQHPFGGFVYFGVLDPGNPAAGERFFIRIDEGGKIIWSKKLDWKPGMWSRAGVLPNGNIIGSGNGSFVVLDAQGNIVKAHQFGAEFNYTIGAGMSKNDMCFGLFSYNEALHYAVRLNPDGSYKGVTQGVRVGAPNFFHTTSKGTMVFGSSYLKGSEAKLELSFLDENGLHIKNARIDNVFGFAPTGAIYDACKYSVHSDAAGNLYVLGVADRTGFFVLRLMAPDYTFACEEVNYDAEPSPVPELATEQYSVFPLLDQSFGYVFNEEPPGQFDSYCTKCDTVISPLPDDTFACNEDARITLDAGNPGAEYLWSDGSTGRTLEVSENGTYTVRIRSRCAETYDTVKVEVFRKPVIQLVRNPLDPLPGESFVLTGSPDTFQVMTWYRSDSVIANTSSVTLSEQFNGRYLYYWEVYDDPRCLTRDSIEVPIFLIDYYFPNAFTPNGDGLNDFWSVAGTGMKRYSIRVYSRWGEKVFDETDGNWDGTYQGKPLPAGIYIYILVGYDEEGRKITQKGDIRLIR